MVKLQFSGHVMRRHGDESRLGACGGPASTLPTVATVLF